MKHLVFTAILLITLPLPSIAQPGQIKMESIAEIEVLTRNADGEEVYIRKPADLVPPGAIVIYTNRFTNISNAPAEGIVVDNPVPENMEYVAGSASKDGADVTFSADRGITYAPPEKLTVLTEEGRTRPAQPKEYTHIRWIVRSPLPPGETGEVEFRALLK